MQVVDLRMPQGRLSCCCKSISAHLMARLSSSNKQWLACLFPGLSSSVWLLAPSTGTSLPSQNWGRSQEGTLRAVRIVLIAVSSPLHPALDAALESLLDFQAVLLLSFLLRAKQQTAICSRWCERVTEFTQNNSQLVCTNLLTQHESNLCVCVCVTRDFPGGSDDKESACNAGEPGSIPGLGRSPGEGNSYPLQ